MPTGLEAYVQVLHPAYAHAGERVRWRDIADRLRQPLLPGAWFEDLQDLDSAKPQTDLSGIHEGLRGEIPDEVLSILEAILGRYTSSNDGWFCLWEGWGSLHRSGGGVLAWPVDHPPPPGAPTHFPVGPGLPPEILNGPKVCLPYREYLLLHGPLAAVGEIGAWISWQAGNPQSYERQTPSLWWPEDRAWCAGNEIDASFTCIGGPRALINELLQHPNLEVLELDPSANDSPSSDLTNDSS